MEDSFNRTLLKSKFWFMRNFDVLLSTIWRNFCAAQVRNNVLRHSPSLWQNSARKMDHIRTRGVAKVRLKKKPMQERECFDQI